MSDLTVSGSYGCDGTYVDQGAGVWYCSAVSKYLFDYGGMVWMIASAPYPPPEYYSDDYQSTPWDSSWASAWITVAEVSPPTYNISGTVTDENNDPYPGVTITATASGKDAVTDTTDASGDYSLNLEDGVTWRLTPTIPAYRLPPVMTANNAPSPYVASAAGAYTSDWAAWKGFDGTDSGKWRHDAASSWLKIDLGAAGRVVTKYKLQAGESFEGYMPTAWTIEGSNNDSDWTTIDTVTGEDAWDASEVREFTCDSPGTTAFRYYRCSMTGWAPIIVGEWYLQFDEVVENWSPAYIDVPVDGEAVADQDFEVNAGGGGGEPLHIRGTLLSGTSGVSGVEVVASHEGLDDCTDTSDENGDYDIAVGVSYITWRVTPDGASYTWYPTYRNVEVESVDVENVDFSTAIAEEAAADLSMSMNLSAAGKAIMGGAAARFGAAALSMTLDFTPQGEWPQPDPSSDKTYWRRRSQFQADARRVSRGRSLAWLDGPPATGITLGLFHALEADFETVAAAGFNTVLSAAWPNVLGQTVASVVAASDAAGLLAGVILPDTPETSQIAAYGSHDAVRAWYAQDEPNTQTDWEDRLAALQGYKDEWDTEKPIMVCCNYASADEYRDRFRAFLAESEIVCHNNYPYRYNLWPRAYTFETPTGLMTNMPIAQDIAEREDREHWVILQAHGQNSTTTGLAMPPAKFLRAQAYASLIQGATGLIWFCMDNAYIRSASLYGVAPSVPQDYGEGGLVISEAQAYWASYAWAAIAAIVADVSRLEDVWLAPTSALDYVITFDEESFTWSKDPICAILKEYEGDYYLFIANIENYPHGVQVILPIEPSVETLLGPTASIEGGTLSVELGAWGVWGGKLTT